MNVAIHCWYYMNVINICADVYLYKCDHTIIYVYSDCLYEYIYANVLVWMLIYIADIIWMWLYMYWCITFINVMILVYMRILIVFDNYVLPDWWLIEIDVFFTLFNQMCNLILRWEECRGAGLCWHINSQYLMSWPLGAALMLALVWHWLWPCLWLAPCLTHPCGWFKGWTEAWTGSCV